VSACQGRAEGSCNCVRGRAQACGPHTGRLRPRARQRRPGGPVGGRDRVADQAAAAGRARGRPGRGRAAGPGLARLRAPVQKVRRGADGAPRAGARPGAPARGCPARRCPLGAPGRSKAIRRSPCLRVRRGAADVRAGPLLRLCTHAGPALSVPACPPSAAPFRAQRDARAARARRSSSTGWPAWAAGTRRPRCATCTRSRPRSRCARRRTSWTARSAWLGRCGAAACAVTCSATARCSTCASSAGSWTPAWRSGARWSAAACPSTCARPPSSASRPAAAAAAAPQAFVKVPGSEPAPLRRGLRRRERAQRARPIFSCREGRACDS